MMESLLEEVVAPDLSAEAPDWCTSCQSLKQQLAQVREEQVQNFQKLKQKIISTDLLIKKYKSKCDDYDIQCKKTDEAIKRADRFQRQTEILETQLKAALLDTEPLRQSKVSLERQLSERTSEVQTLSDQILSLEGVNRQYENLTRANSADLERLNAERKEHLARIKCLEAGKLEKGEAKEYKSEISSLKKEKTSLMKTNHRLEKKLSAAITKIELMKNNQKSSPYRRKRTGSGNCSSPIKSPGAMWSPKIFKPSPGARGRARTTSERSSSSQRRDMLGDPIDKKPVSEMESSSSEDSDDDRASLMSFKWTLSPVAPCISPLPPTPLCVDTNKIHKAEASNSEEEDDDVSDIADQLEQQLLEMDDKPQQHESSNLGTKSDTSQIKNSSDFPCDAMDNIQISDEVAIGAGNKSSDRPGAVDIIPVCVSDETGLDRAPQDEAAEQHRDTGQVVETETCNTQDIVDNSHVNTQTVILKGHLKEETVENTSVDKLHNSNSVSVSDPKCGTLISDNNEEVNIEADSKNNELIVKTNAEMSTENNGLTFEETYIKRNEFELQEFTNSCGKHVLKDQNKAEESNENSVHSHHQREQIHKVTDLGTNTDDKQSILKSVDETIGDRGVGKMKVENTGTNDKGDIQIWKEDQVETVKGCKLTPVSSCVTRHEVDFESKARTKLHQDKGIEKKYNKLSNESNGPIVTNINDDEDKLTSAKASCSLVDKLSRGSSSILEESVSFTEETDFDFTEGYNILSRDSTKADNSPKAIDKNVKKRIRKTKEKLLQKCKYVDLDGIESINEKESKKELLDSKLVPIVELCAHGDVCRKQAVKKCTFDKGESSSAIGMNAEVRETGITPIVPVLQSKDSAHAFRPVQSVAHREKELDIIGEAAKEVKVKHSEDNSIINASVTDNAINKDHSDDIKNNTVEGGVVVTRQLSTGFTVHRGSVERSPSSDGMKPFRSPPLKVQFDSQNICDTIDEENSNSGFSVTDVPTGKSEEQSFGDCESLSPKMDESEDIKLTEDLSQELKSDFQKEGSNYCSSQVKNIFKNKVRIVSDNIQPGCSYSESASGKLSLSASLLISNTFKTVSKQLSDSVNVMGEVNTAAHFFRSISRGSSLSLESLDRTSPVSPLSISPFCFATPISPLPPSPVRDLERVSPLSPERLGEGGIAQDLSTHTDVEKCVKTEVNDNTAAGHNQESTVSPEDLDCNTEIKTDNYEEINVLKHTIVRKSKHEVSEINQTQSEGTNKTLTENNARQVYEMCTCVDDKKPSDTESGNHFTTSSINNGFEVGRQNIDVHTNVNVPVIKDENLTEKHNMDLVSYKTVSQTAQHKHVANESVANESVAQTNLTNTEIKTEVDTKSEINSDKNLTVEKELKPVTVISSDVVPISEAKSGKLQPHVKSEKEKIAVEGQSVSAKAVPLDQMKMSPVPSIISPIKTPAGKRFTKVIQSKSKMVNLTECFIPKPDNKRKAGDKPAEQQCQDLSIREKLKKLKQDVQNSPLSANTITNTSPVKQENETKTSQNVNVEELGCVRKSGRVVVRKSSQTRSKSSENKHESSQSEKSSKDTDLEKASIDMGSNDDRVVGDNGGYSVPDIDDKKKEADEVPSGMDNWAFKRRTRLAHKSDIKPLRPGRIQVIDPPVLPPSVARSARKRKSLLTSHPTEDACKKQVTEHVQQKGCVGTRHRKDDVKNIHAYLKSSETAECFVTRMMAELNSSGVPDMLLSLCVEVLGKVTTDSLDTVYEVCLNDQHRELQPAYFPFLNDIDKKSLQLFQYLQTNSQWGISYLCVLTMLWQSIFSREASLTIIGKMSLCRVYTAVCATHGDVERVRVLFYHIYTCGFLSGLELLVPIISVWPRVLQRDPADILGKAVTPSDLPDKGMTLIDLPVKVMTPGLTLVLEEVISRSLAEMDNDFGKKVMCILHKLCHWSGCHGNTEAVLKTLLNKLAFVTHPVSRDHSAIFELVKACGLLLSRQPWSWVRDQFVIRHGLQSAVNRYRANRISVAVAPEYMCAILQITSNAVFAHSSAVPTQDLQHLAKTWLLPLLSHHPGSAKVRNSCLETLLELCPFHPPILVSLQDWFSHNVASVHNNMVSRLEELRCSLKRCTGVICMPFVK